MTDPFAVLKALACGHRANVVVACELHPYTISELAEWAGLSQPTMSKHVKILRDAGLVYTERAGQSVQVRTVDRRAMRETLVNALTVVCPYPFNFTIRRPKPARKENP